MQLRTFTLLTDEEMDDENEEIDDDLQLSELSTKQKKRRNEDTEAESDESMTHAIVCTFLASETSRLFILMMAF